MCLGFIVGAQHDGVHRLCICTRISLPLSPLPDTEYKRDDGIRNGHNCPD